MFESTPPLPKRSQNLVGPFEAADSLAQPYTWTPQRGPFPLSLLVFISEQQQSYFYSTSALEVVNKQSSFLSCKNLARSIQWSFGIACNHMSWCSHVCFLLLNGCNRHCFFNLSLFMQALNSPKIYPKNDTNPIETLYHFLLEMFLLDWHHFLNKFLACLGLAWREVSWKIPPIVLRWILIL